MENTSPTGTSDDLKTIDRALLLMLSHRQRDRTPLSQDDEALIDNWFLDRLPPVDADRAVELIKYNEFAAERVLERRLVEAANAGPSIPRALEKRILRASRPRRPGWFGGIHQRWQMLSGWQWSGMGAAVTATAALAIFGLQGWQTQNQDSVATLDSGIVGIEPKRVRTIAILPDQGTIAETTPPAPPRVMATAPAKLAAPPPRVISSPLPTADPESAKRPAVARVAPPVQQAAAPAPGSNASRSDQGTIAETSPPPGWQARALSDKRFDVAMVTIADRSVLSDETAIRTRSRQPGITAAAPFSDIDVPIALLRRAIDSAATDKTSGAASELATYLNAVNDSLDIRTRILIDREFANNLSKNGNQSENISVRSYDLEDQRAAEIRGAIPALQSGERSVLLTARP